MPDTVICWSRVSGVMPRAGRLVSRPPATLLILCSSINDTCRLSMPHRLHIHMEPLCQNIAMREAHLMTNVPSSFRQGRGCRASCGSWCCWRATPGRCARSLWTPPPRSRRQTGVRPGRCAELPATASAARHLRITASTCVSCLGVFVLQTSEAPRSDLDADMQSFETG